MSQDKRQFDRDEIEEIVKVYVFPDPHSNSTFKVDNQPLLFKARNISQEGICLETKEFFIPNQLFKLDFQHAHYGNTQTYASVVWSEKNACGLRFIKSGEYLNQLIETKGKL